ncbi:hypothetical protein SAL_2294, partial [Streptococcus agalactiae 515]
KNNIFSKIYSNFNGISLSLSIVLLQDK